MPKPHDAKIASVPKKLLVGVVIAAAIIVVGCIIWVIAAEPTLRVAGHTYRLDIANTPSERAQGLGNRPSMPVDRGMLFTFARSGNYCFWMKNMHFPLDIIWTDSSKRIIKIEQNLSPQTYPKSYCPSGTSTSYVIELNAGQAKATHMQVGQQLNF